MSHNDYEIEKFRHYQEFIDSNVGRYFHDESIYIGFITGLIGDDKIDNDSKIELINEFGSSIKYRNYDLLAFNVFEYRDLYLWEIIANNDQKAFFESTLKIAQNSNLDLELRIILPVLLSTDL